MRKSLLLKYGILLIITLIGLSFFTTFGAGIFLQNVNNIYKLSNNIYLNSDYLNKTYLVYKSNYDITDAVFQSSCNTETKLIEKRDDLYLFELKVTNKDCSNNIFFLKSKLGILNEIKLNLIPDYKIYSILLDYSSRDLKNILNSVDKKSSSLKIFTDYKNSILDDKYKFSKKKRTYEELIYKSEITKKILEKRELKYIIPVPGYNLPTKNATKFPNAGRPYRAGLTDGIHHSWDIDAPFGTKIVSLDDGIIIRIVRAWDKTDLANIRRGNKLSVEDKMRNLDIYRGNQVWIKTMKGELVMYAHLDKVVDSIKEGTIIKSGDYIGNIGITGVPEEGYDDYHLDFSVSENPYNLGKAGSYEIVDYMSWPWKFKGKSKDYIVNNQDNVFKK